MIKQSANSNLPKKILFNFVFPAFLGWAIYHLVARALEVSNLIEAAIYWILAMACVISGFIAICPSKAKQIGSEIRCRFACRFFPGSRYAKPPLSYTAARKFLAEKKYAEAITAFQEILRNYPEEKEPYKQIIWIANLTGQKSFRKNSHSEAEVCNWQLQNGITHPCCDLERRLRWSCL